MAAKTATRSINPNHRGNMKGNKDTSNSHALHFAVIEKYAHPQMLGLVMSVHQQGITHVSYQQPW